MPKTFKDKLEEKFGVEIFNEYEIVGEYEGYNKKIKFLHKACGNNFLMRPNDFLNGHRCPECAKQKRAKKSNITLESYKAKVEGLFPKEYEILSDNITKLSDKIRIKHLVCGNIYEATARNLLRGMGCRKCAVIKGGIKQKGISKSNKRARIESNDDFIERVKKLYGDKLKPLEEYNGTKNEIWFEKTKETNPIKKFVRITPNHLFTRGIPKYNKIKNTDELKQRVELLIGTEYSVIGNYIDGKTKILFQHNSGNCNNNQFEMRPEDFLNGQRCPECAKQKRSLKLIKSDISKFKDKVKEMYGDEYSVVSEYRGLHKYITIQHNCEKCNNHIFNVFPDNFIRNETKCPICFGTPKRTDSEISEEITSTDSDYEYIPNTYVNAQSKFKIKHKTCGHIFETTMINFRHGCRCPNCAFKSESTAEKEILEYVQGFYPNAKKKRFFPDENNKREFIEADICIEELKLIIEYDGLYWHSFEKLKNKKYHINKTKFFDGQGYRTVHIFEDEWKNNKELVKKKLLHILKQDNQERIFARKCTVKEIDSKVSNEFLDKYHIQGGCQSRIKEGLFYNDELVAVITFGSLRSSLGQKNNKNKNYVELVRYATNKTIVGGFSKLLKYCIRKYNFDRILTYADLRWSPLKDNVYDKNGFTLLHISEPNYWYFKPGEVKRYHRYNFRKDRLKEKFPDAFDNNLTEYEIMKKVKYNKIYDCGNLVYEMTIKKN